MLIRVQIQGQSPLLMHAFNAKAEESVQNSGRRAHVGERQTPREEAESFAYKLKDGRLYIPGPAIFSAIVEAGKFHKQGRNKLTTNATSLVPSALWLAPEFAECVMLDGAREFEVDSRRVVNQVTRGAHMAHRPRLDKWTATFELEVDETFLSEKLARALVDDAGMRIGVGAFRPQKKGPFGRFKVIDWKAT